jgi:ABC transport system ATP-binding/permease protein
LMLAIPPVIALIHLVLSSTTQLNPIEEPGRPPLVFSLFVFLIILTAALLVRNEIFKEKAVYQRESRTTSLLFPYVLSKVWLVGLLAIYQGLVWTIIHSLKEIQIGLAGGFQALLPSAILLCLVAFVGGILGLIVSVLSRTQKTTIDWVLLLTAPQLLLIFSLLSDWSKLAITSLGLIVVLVAIQHRAGSAKT